MKHLSFIVTLIVALGLGGCVTRTSYVDLYGQAAPPSAATRTIVITPGTRYVNVEGGEVIRFVVGNKEFGWHFNGAIMIRSFSLNDVAPPGTLDHPVEAFVAPDPKYIDGEE